MSDCEWCNGQDAHGKHENGCRLGVGPDELLHMAERVCALVGWTAVDDTPRGKALHEVWRQWAAVRPGMTAREAWPDLSDKVIAGLAERRDVKRAETLARIEAV